MAAAIAVASRGFSVQVHERRRGPVDKACGEGVMPEGARILGALGVRPGRSASFAAIRYVQEDGSEALGRFPSGKSGLGIRRPLLHEALALRARELGVDLREGSEVKGFSRDSQGITLDTRAGKFAGRLLVVADGLSSPLRKQAGLDGAPVRSRRFGVRRHFRIGEGDGFRPDEVQVHFGKGAEAYLTPVGPGEVGLAFLWEPGAVGPGGFASLLGGFPRLHERFSPLEPLSEVRGAGPLFRRVRRRTAEGLVLLGDAAGYVDALTGEGLTLAFAAAADLGSLLPGILARGATADSLAPFERRCTRRFTSYAVWAHGLLFLARRPALRGSVVRGLGASPWLFERILGAVV